MTSAKQFGKRPKGRVSGAVAVAITSMMTAAGAYRCAAENDERRGFSYTAAMEWRKAAELLAGAPSIADQCWREWERIMRLPRRLAVPLELRDVVDVPMLSATRMPDLRNCAVA